MTVTPDNPLTVFVSFPPAYSVDAVPLPEGINVWRHGEYWIGCECRMVDYPTVPDQPDFLIELKRVLMPMVEEFPAKAEADEKVERAAGAHGGHESYQAIRED